MLGDDAHPKHFTPRMKYNKNSSCMKGGSERRPQPWTRVASPSCVSSRYSAALYPARGVGRTPQPTTQIGVPTAVPLLLQGHAALLQLLADVNGHLRPHVPGRRRGNKQQVGGTKLCCSRKFQNPGWKEQ